MAVLARRAAPFIWKARTLGQIYRLRLWESPQAASNATLIQLRDPNYLFGACCAERGIPPACRQHCNFQMYNKDLLNEIFLGKHYCPMDAIAEMHFCAAQGRDHSQYCRARGVTSVLAGEKCLTFCDQIPDKRTHVDYSYASCFDRFDDIKQCFYTNVAKKAAEYFAQ